MQLLSLGFLFSGGISSFALTLLCISFFQLHPTFKGSEEVNLGNLLLGFLELYGQKFDYEKNGITIRDGGKYLPREQLPCETNQLFCIDDPVYDLQNVCEFTHRGPEVKKAFNDAYVVLSTAVSSRENNTKDCAEYSILGQIIHVSDDLINYRNWVQNSFSQRFKDQHLHNIP